MIKTGIYKLEQLGDSSNYRGFFGGEKRVSITLYEHINNGLDCDSLAELILCQFTNDRGAYKRTYIKRFEEFDSLALSELLSNFKNNEFLSIHDVGVSDGRTANDFFLKVTKIFKKIEYIASDNSTEFYVLCRKKTKVVISKAGKIIEVLWPPFVFNTIAPENPTYYPVNFLIRQMVVRLLVKPLVRDYEERRLQAKRLKLFSPAVLRCAQLCTNFKLEEHDLLVPFDGQVHVIRAMNVLNPSYFSDYELEKIVRNIYFGLDDGGIFITGSNKGAGTTVHGGIFKKRGCGFDKLHQSGRGSPIEHFILGGNW